MSSKIYHFDYEPRPEKKRFEPIKAFLTEIGLSYAPIASKSRIVQGTFGNKISNNPVYYFSNNELSRIIKVLEDFEQDLRLAEFRNVYQVCQDWRMNYDPIADAIGMNRNTFKAKMNPQADKYAFTPDESELIVKHYRNIRKKLHSLLQTLEDFKK